MHKILLFGSTGFIGKNIVDTFSKNPQFSVVGLSSKDCDLCNKAAVTALLQKHNYADYIINAAYQGVGLLSEDPDFLLQKNMYIIRNILQACRLLKKPKKIICFGSGLEYGNDDKPIGESHCLDPLNSYARSKMITSNLTLKLGKELRLPVILLKPFNLYGQYDNKSVIYYIMSSLAQRHDISLSKGKQIRDYLYVEDLVDAIMKLLRNSGDNSSCEVFNIGSGSEVALKDIFYYCFSLFHMKPVYNVIPYRILDYYHQCADIRKITALTGWKPKTSILDGIKKTYAYMIKQVHLV